jgi:SAM-dependent methyltransferase
MSENIQKQHYETIHDSYVEHYYDPTSMNYRNQFMYKYLFEGIDLNNKKIADLACGSGYNSLSLLNYFPCAELHGFDISKKACEDYKNLVKRPSYELDLTRQANLNPEYDCAMIIGGLHHCITDLEATFQNIFSLLKPGGILLMVEPNKNYFLEPLRKFWYRNDKYFEENTEEALDHELMLNQQSKYFRGEKIFHLGGPAYFLIYNSLLFRLPIGVKKIISPTLMFMEKVYNTLPGKIFYPYFVSRWIKK